jgi:hypothetical protein
VLASDLSKGLTSCGSAAYWAAVLAVVPVLAVITAATRVKLLKEYHAKLGAGVDFGARSCLAARNPQPKLHPSHNLRAFSFFSRAARAFAARLPYMASCMYGGFGGGEVGLADRPAARLSSSSNTRTQTSSVPPTMQARAMSGGPSATR